jgi:hypothetical protein
MQSCPWCGELFEVFPDPGGGESQDYVEDCAVCCRPVRIRAVYSEDSGEYQIEVRAER